MIVMGPTLMSLPVAVALWALDGLLFLFVLRLALARTPYAALANGLAPFTDALVERVVHWLPNLRNLRPAARWALAVTFLVVLRCLLIGFLVLLSHGDGQD